jgi:hypothetical protein
MNRKMQLVAAATFVALICPSVRAAEPIQFNRDVRPILSEYCFACHGPDNAGRKAKLRLDDRASAIKAGAIEPGKPDSSELIRRIFAHDTDVRMPPASTKKSLTEKHRATLKRWIETGADYQGHWAFSPPVRPAEPVVSDASWLRNPIDRFVLARLEQQGLKPSPEADRRTLARRLSLDLLGLPPTPEQVEAFVNDRSPNAYEAYVDRLLQSPHYGERMAMPWLDGARYADSNGFQTDSERYMWRWRDWVIDAFNKNQPFDQFTIDQLAGDLIANATPEQRIATGFSRNHRINEEGGAIPEEWLVELVADRVETTSLVWLGLTMGCARCHDHKYDPITQKDFYRFFAFFNNVPEGGTGGAGNSAPIMRAPRAGDVETLARLDAAIAAAERDVRTKEKGLPAMQAEWEKTFSHNAAKPADTWVMLQPSSVVSVNGATVTRLDDGSYLASGKNPSRDSYTIMSAIPVPRLTGILLDVLPHESLPEKSFGRHLNGNFILDAFEVEVSRSGDVKPQIVAISKAMADYSQPGWPIESVIDRRRGQGWAGSGNEPSKRVPRQAVFTLAEPITVSGGMTLTVRMRHDAHITHAIGRFRLSVTAAPVPAFRNQSGVPDAILKALAVDRDKRTETQKADVANYFRSHYAGDLTVADRVLAAARKAKADFEATVPTVMVMQEMPKPRDTFVLIRGQYDKKGDRVTMGLPAALPPMPDGAPTNRLGLAKWLVDPSNPLTARVAVNRFWEKFFGIGIVKTSENLGLQGEYPSHPELLDWLAAEFVRLKWDMKAIQKTIVMSATYRQSSAVTPDMFEMDPENRLFARGPRFRLQAELVRDNALAISGLLVPTIGGKSVRPYQPAGVWNETSVYGNLLNYQHDKGDGLYRRSMYTIWKRTAAPPQMLMFDSPSREYCTVKRSRTNTPLQALTLLNDITFVEASRVLAERMILEGGSSPESRIRFAFRRAVSRDPSDEELRPLVRGLQDRLRKYRAQPDLARKLISIGESKPDAKLDAAELAAHTLAASVILNLDETVTKE